MPAYELVYGFFANFGFFAFVEDAFCKSCGEEAYGVNHAKEKDKVEKYVHGKLSPKPFSLSFFRSLMMCFRIPAAAHAKTNAVFPKKRM
jgi:hypothetical protein